MSSHLHQQCSICLDPIDATIRSTARLSCDYIGLEFNFGRMMQCPNRRLVEEGEWLFEAGGFQQSIATDDLDVENDEDINEDDGDDDDDYFYVSPSMRMYLMQNRRPFSGISLPPQNFHPMVPGSLHPANGYAGTQAHHNFLVPRTQYDPIMNNNLSITMANSQSRSHLLVAQRNVVDVSQTLGHTDHPNPGHITNPQGPATVGQAHHTWPAPMIHGWPALIHSRVAQLPQRPAVSHPVPIRADVAGLGSSLCSWGQFYPSC